MARVGVAKPYFGVYGATDNVVSYTYVGRLAYLTSIDVSLNNSEPVILYADNAPRESASAFGGGTLTLGVDELLVDIASKILGLSVTELEESEGGGTVLDFVDAIAPYVGVGFVVSQIVGGASKFMAVVLRKVQFQVPPLSVTTQGETIEFQTPELTATILKDDQATPRWQQYGFFDTESAAEAWVQTTLGKTAG